MPHRFGANVEEVSPAVASGYRFGSVEAVTPTAPKPTSVRELEERPEPSIIERAAVNAIPSAVNWLNSQRPGANGDNPALNGKTRTVTNPITGKSVDLKDAASPDVAGELLGTIKGIGHLVLHPLESFADDPAGTAAVPATLARGVYEKVKDFQPAQGVPPTSSTVSDVMSSPMGQAAKNAVVKAGTRFLAKRIPGIGLAMDVADLLKESQSPAPPPGPIRPPMAQPPPLPAQPPPLPVQPPPLPAQPPPLPPQSPAAALAQELMGSPEGGTIAPAKADPAKALFEQKARTARGPKVEALAKHLNDAGITADQIPDIPKVKWRDISDALGIDLPKTLTATVRDVQKAVFELQKAKKPAPVVFMPSADAMKSLQKPGAMEAARKFAEAMGQ